ncbi:XapX domain-containing protein [Vibrio diabolicus]
MTEIMLSTLAGVIIGLVYTAIKLPIPATPVFQESWLLQVSGLFII